MSIIYYAYDNENYLSHWHEDATRERSTSVAPTGIPPAQARWDGTQWVADPSREQAKALAVARAAAVAAVQKRLDTPAQEWGYDNIHTAASYAGDQNPRFNAEGTVLKRFRSETWEAVDRYQNTVTTEEELFALLPPIPTRPAV